ncbi:hypothetical protein BHE90_017784, partial [Fusarium euwallaceae]
ISEPAERDAEQRIEHPERGAVQETKILIFQMQVALDVLSQDRDDLPIDKIEHVHQKKNAENVIGIGRCARRRGARWGRHSINPLGSFCSGHQPSRAYRSYESGFTTRRRVPGFDASQARAARCASLRDWLEKRAELLAMANWSDPRPNASAFPAAGTVGTAAFDAGLRSYMLSVYNYMLSGILLTGLVAMFFSWGGLDSPAAHILIGGGPLAWIIMLAPLGFVFGMSYGAARMAPSTLQAMFWGFAVAMVLSLSTVFLRYTGTSVAQAFFATSAAFAGLSLYGYTTKRDLSAFGTFLVMGLVGLIVASLLNLFF